MITKFDIKFTMELSIAKNDWNMSFIRSLQIIKEIETLWVILHVINVHIVHQLTLPNVENYSIGHGSEVQSQTAGLWMRFRKK